jgi:hypothetical protein
MTFAELEQAAATLRFGGGLGMWRPEVTVRRHPLMPEWARLNVQFWVPGRDELSDKETPRSPWGYGAIMVPQRHAWTLRPFTAIEDLDLLALAPSTMPAHALIRKLVLAMVLHELDESLLFDGKRLYDPHAPKFEQVAGVVAESDKKG